MHLAEQVLARRTEAGLTQAELASRSGVTSETIARLERVLRGRPSANANPSLETLERIASSLGCHAADLIDIRSSKPTGDPLVAMLQLVKPATRIWVTAMVEACLRAQSGQGKRKGD